jgi:hypothetical protein
MDPCFHNWAKGCKESQKKHEYKKERGKYWLFLRMRCHDNLPLVRIDVGECFVD